MPQSVSIRYILELIESHNSRNRQYRGWLVGHGRGRGPQHLTELTILWMASTIMGEVGAHNRRHAPGQNDKTIGSKIYYFDKLIGTRKTNSVNSVHYTYSLHYLLSN